MHDEIVERRQWVEEGSFLHALNFCMLLPGPEAQQLATYMGWMRKGVKGGLLAGGLFILPGFVSILILSILYVQWGTVNWVEGFFAGIGPAVIAIVAHAVMRIGRRTIHNRVMFGIAATAFVAIFFFQLPFPLIILVAGVLGLVGVRSWPTTFMTIDRHPVSREVAATKPGRRRTASMLAVGLALWLLPVAIIAAVTGSDSIWTNIGVFFSQAAVVTFGGAYSVLAYMAQQVVEVYGWLHPGEMVDGLALAETTPGPLIQVTQFVGFLAAYRNSGGLAPMAAAILGSVLTAWVTFVPSFLWILVGAPHVERLKNRPALTGALSTITAAVVGVILNLAVWFGIYTLFGEVRVSSFIGARLLIPSLSSADPFGLLVVAASAYALFRHNTKILHVVAGSAIAGVVVGLIR